ncbi:MAG: ATP-dependent Clp protease ATP-binding subunit, partial [Clostridia bacterium]|nr:ATP-dependent Clp protease ATP-binding subunit [Clostridia bacterium]
MPECSAYGILAGEGVTKNEYEELFFKCIDTKSKYEGLTRRTQTMYDRAVLLSEETETKAGTAHMLYAILENDECMAVKILRKFADLEVLRGRTKQALKALKNKMLFGEESDAQEQTTDPLKAEFDNTVAPDLDKPKMQTPTLEKGGAFERLDEKKSAAAEKLTAYGIDLTERAMRGKIDPVIGRQKEIEKMIQVLSRRLKNNPVLIGEPGVGKSAIVEGLAQLIVNGDVPEQLYNKTVFSVDMPGMLAGARYRGDFEERLKDMIGAVIEDGDVVLFIDEIHTIVGAGASSDNGMDAANILKPMLARGDLQVIGATTIEEYRKYIEKDPALERRFTPVWVEEPSEKDAITILKGLRKKYEQHHSIVITDEAIEAAVKLSARYITDRFLPDKAIDLIDEAAARVRVLEDGGAEIKTLETEIRNFEEERVLRERRGEFALATAAFENLRLAKDKLAAVKQAQAPLILPDGRAAIGKEQVAAIVSARVKIPLLKITQEESEKLLRLEEELHRRIIGQNEGVSAVAKAIRRARAGVKDPSRPIGSFMFVGPTGVGKT